MENRETSKKYIGRFCPVCKRKIQEGENVTMCPVCTTPHHKDCWEKNGGCAGTYDCPESPQEAQEPKPVKVCTDCGAKSVEVQQSCPECGMPEIVSKQNICKNCGTELQEDHLFCPKCGKDTCVVDDVHNKHEEPIRCTQCGTMNHTFDAYCIRCGASLKAEASEQKDTEQKTTTYGRYFVPALTAILLIVIVCVFVFSFGSKKGNTEKELYGTWTVENVEFSNSLVEYQDLLQLAFECTFLKLNSDKTGIYRDWYTDYDITWELEWDSKRPIAVKIFFGGELLAEMDVVDEGLLLIKKLERTIVYITLTKDN